MEKILQILAVFGLLMLVILRFYRGQEEKFRRFGFLGRLKVPLSLETGRGLEAEIGMVEERERYGVQEDVDAFLFDEDSRMLFCYSVEGRLTIYRRLLGGINRELQELSVPLDCTAMTLDRQERKLYLKEEGEWFVYGAEREG